MRSFLNIVNSDKIWTYNGLIDHLTIIFKETLQNYTYILILSVLYLLIRVIIYRKTKEKKEVSFDIFFWLIFGFLPFLGTVISSRHVIPFMVLFSILIGIFLSDLFLFIYKFINKLSSKVSKYIPMTVLFLMYFIILLIFFQSYSWQIKEKIKNEPVSLIERYFGIGVFYPLKLNLKWDDITLKTLRLLNDGDSVFIFPYSPATNHIFGRLKHSGKKNLTLYNLMECLLEYKNIPIFNACHIKTLVEERELCKYDAVIDSDSFIFEYSSIIFDSFPEREILAIDAREVWTSCKDNFTLNATINDVYFDASHNFTFFIYKRK